MAVAAVAKRLAAAAASAGARRSISTSPVLYATGTKKGKIAQDAKKTGYKKGGRKGDKKGSKDSANRKDAGVGATVFAQVMAKPRQITVKTKISDAEREKMLAEMKELAKETSRILMRELRDKQYYEMKMLKLKQAAVAALPPELREKIKPIPAVRRNTVPPTLVPPIDGYSDDVAVARKSAMARKMR